MAKKAKSTQFAESHGLAKTDLAAIREMGGSVVKIESEATLTSVGIVSHASERDGEYDLVAVNDATSMANLKCSLRKTIPEAFVPQEK